VINIDLLRAKATVFEHLKSTVSKLQNWCLCKQGIPAGTYMPSQGPKRATHYWLRATFIRGNLPLRTPHNGDGRQGASPQHDAGDMNCGRPCSVLVGSLHRRPPIYMASAWGRTSRTLSTSIVSSYAYALSAQLFTQTIARLHHVYLAKFASRLASHTQGNPPRSVSSRYIIQTKARPLLGSTNFVDRQRISTNLHRRSAAPPRLPYFCQCDNPAQPFNFVTVNLQRKSLRWRHTKTAESVRSAVLLPWPRRTRSETRCLGR
jgi:hypothetical protein